MPNFNSQAIADPDKIRALSSAVRQELVDTLAALGGQADVATLAEQLGRPADGLYYHLRLLVSRGLVEEIETEGRAQARYRLAGNGLPLRLAYRKDLGGNLEEVRRFVRSLLQIAELDFERGSNMPAAVMAGPRRELWAARDKGWVSPRDLEEINMLIERLNHLVSQPSSPERTRLMTLAFVLAPVEPQPKRRASSPDLDE